MNILQILPELHVGGVETGTIDLAGYLIKRGHKAVVVSAGGELVKELEAIGARHYKLPVHKKSIFTIMKMIPCLIEIIQKEEIEIVHARSRVPAWIAYFACRRTKRVFITTCHGFYKKHLFSCVMGWGRRVIVLSNVIARHRIDDFGVAYECIKLIPRSVDTGKFKYICPSAKRKTEFNIGIIGRITPIKGHMHFIKAAAKASRSIPGLKIWIVGDAPVSKEAYKEQLQILVKRLGLKQNTEFLGTQRDIPAILSHLDLLVLATTTQEAFGRVIIEAQAAGVPVVAAKVGGVVDIIKDGKTGLLVPPGDSTTMGEAMVRIFQHKELADQLAEAAYKRVQEEYSLETMGKNTLAVYQDACSNFKILIVKFSSLGDVILSTAGIKAIREKFPKNYKISFLVDEECKDVLLSCPYIDELLICDLNGKDKGLSGIFKLGTILRKKNFDIVIDLQNNRKSHLLAGFILAYERYGYNNKKFAFLLNHSIKDDKSPIGPVSHQFRILKMLGVDLREQPSLELWPQDRDRRYIADFLNSEWINLKPKLVGINISASSRWLTKNLPLDHVVEVCKELNRRDMRVVITGTEKDLCLANTLISRLGNVKLINACGKTSINQLVCLIERCGVYISCDSAPLHIAAAVKTPFIALFGPTDPRRHLPPAKKFVLLKANLSCGPCYKSKCPAVKCMAAIKPEEIVEAVEKLLKEG
ncbi:MAG: lipopolysaccharide heptosyltransferase II [Candidatus Omnitrophota bacterium]